MDLLLDTNVWVWRLLDKKRVSRAAKSALDRLEAHGGRAVLAEISLFEAADNVAHGRFLTYEPLREWLHSSVAKSGVVLQRLTPDIAFMAAKLSWPSADAFDRIIVATAQTLDIPLVTSDGAIADNAEVKVIW